MATHIAQERQDNLSGVVVGGDYVAWQIVYDGRTQSGRHYADTAELAEADARVVIDALKADHCGPPCYLYPDPSLWTIRIWEG